MIRVELWADGSGTSKGPGGWAFVLRAIDTDTGEVLKQVERSGPIPEATNNRAEITAVLQGLASLNMRSNVHVYSDSEYVVNAVSKGWLAGWAGNDWRRATKPKTDGPEPRYQCPRCGAMKPMPETQATVACLFHGDPVVMRENVDRRAVVNRDLWEEMLQALGEHTVAFHHVKGHSGIELNEMCDKAAGEARRSIMGERAPA